MGGQCAATRYAYLRTRLVDRLLSPVLRVTSLVGSDWTLSRLTPVSTGPVGLLRLQAILSFSDCTADWSQWGEPSEISGTVIRIGTCNIAPYLVSNAFAYFLPFFLHFGVFLLAPFLLLSSKSIKSRSANVWSKRFEFHLAPRVISP